MRTGKRQEEERSRSMKAGVCMSGTHCGEQKRKSTRKEKKKIKRNGRRTPHPS